MQALTPAEKDADHIRILAVAFGAVGLSHAIADPLSAWFGATFGWAQRLSFDSSFFWLVFIATIIGVALSFTGARKLQGPGAAKVGSVFVYMLVATVGLNMNIGAILDSPVYFLIGGAAAFHPSLAPVGVLLAVLGYIIGTAAGWFTGLVMMTIAAGAA